MLDEFESAINEVDSLLGGYPIRRLSSKELDSVTISHVKEGWAIDTDLAYEGQAVRMLLLVKEGFPYSIPVVVTEPALPVLKYPHVEEGGKLCVWPDDASVEPLSLSYIEPLLIDAYGLVRKNLNQELTSDFQDGFLSYWGRYCKGDFKSLSLCNLGDDRTRVIYVAYNKFHGAIFHDSKDELEQWIANKGLYKHQIYSSVLVSLNTPWTPDEYPIYVSELVDNLRQLGKGDDEIGGWLKKTLNAKVENPALLIRVKTNVGICAVSLSFEGSIHSKCASSLRCGYRTNKVPNQVMTLKAGHLKLYGGKVSRCDYKWLHGRDENPFLDAIGGTKVAILGVGSVGSSVVSLLVKAGVKDILISDNDLLEPENISRHHLGVSSIKSSKVSALKSHINENYPHINVQTTYLKWHEDDQFLAEMKNADVVVSCTADWLSDVKLIQLSKRGDIDCPVVFGFTEAHAAASHCIVNPLASDEALKLFTASGELITPVVEWSEDTSRRLPLCGGSYQPYGAVELSYCHSLITETVLDLILGNLDPNHLHHRVWIGSKRLIDSCKGKWNDKWVEKHTAPDQGSFILDVS